jgi:limonene-1,2-epoxide hydrolase
MASAEEIVREFCTAVSKRDTAALRPLLADDVVYHNIGAPASIGIEATLASIAGQWEMFSTVYRFEIRHITGAGDVVLTERTDVVGAEGQPMPVPLMGVFEVRDGKIAHWRDYFDTGLIAKMSTGEDVTGLVP